MLQFVKRSAAVSGPVDGLTCGRTYDLASGRVSGLCRRGLALAVIAALLSACALVKPAEKPRETYDLTISDSVSNIAGSTRAQLLVKLPTAIKSINSDRMILKPTPSVVTYVAGAQWADNVPRLVQAKLVEAFENTAATGATAIPGEGLVIDYQLVSEIRRFEIIDGSAVIEISIKLLSDKTGIVRDTRIFTASAGASGDTAEHYVAAFDSAFNELSREVITWVLRQV